MDKNTILLEYENWLVENRKRSNTIKTYIRNVNIFLNWLYERYNEDNPIAITQLDLEEYQAYLLNIKKYKPTGIVQRMNSILSYARFLYLEKNLKVNPIDKFKLIKVNKKNISPSVLSKHQIYAFRREVHKGSNFRDIAIIEILLGTGIRVNELIQLEIDDIEISDRKGNLYIREGKGGKPRELPLNKDIRNALIDYLKIRSEAYGKSLWIGQRGPLTKDAINKMLNRYASKVESVKKINPHAFRHYLASRLVRDKKIDLVTVAYILGHSDSRTTQIYVSPSVNEIANVLEDIHIG